MAFWNRERNSNGPALTPIGSFPDDLLKHLARRAQMRILPPLVDPGPAWNPNRNQYDSTRLLAELRRLYPGPVVGATALDLFVPVLTFVFGEAEMPGRVALFSIHRLREEFYGLPRNAELLETRALRELWHEFGHTRGLPHCRDWSCVMSSSHSVTQVDAKTERFCPACTALLERAAQAAETPRRP